MRELSPRFPGKIAGTRHAGLVFWVGFAGVYNIRAQSSCSISSRQMSSAERPAASAAKAKTASDKPKGPSEMVAALIKALNSGNPSAIRRFVAEEYSESALSERPVKDRVDVYLSFHDEAGEVVLCHIDESNGEEITAVVQETDSPQRHRFMFALDPTPPHKIYVVNIDVL